MNRAECERKMANLAKQMYKLYKQYNPDGDYLTMSWFNDGTLMFWNAHYREDAEHPLNYHEGGDEK